MIEYPESKTFAEQMKAALTGKIISNVCVEQSPHKFAFFKGNKEQYEEMLEGEKVTGAAAFGGHIVLYTEQYMLTFADGAYPRFYEEKKMRPKKHQFMLEFDDDTAIAVSIQMYGIIGVFLPEEVLDDGYYRLAVEKPDVLSDAFTLSYFQSLYEPDKKMSLKAFLATEQRIPGLGNGVFQDIAWSAGLDPRFPVQSMTETDFERVYESVRETMRKMTEGGGRDTEKDFYGQRGKYIVQLSKNSYMEPCIKCGSMISKTNYMGGTIYFCSKCQRMK